MFPLPKNSILKISLRKILWSAIPSQSSSLMRIALVACLILGLNANVSICRELAHSITLSPAERTIDFSQASFGYEGYNDIKLASGISLALHTLTIPIVTTGEFAIVSLTPGATELIGSISPSGLGAIDIPTADDNRYDDIQPAVGRFFENGFQALEINE
ncbi:MAG: hypothetical protein IIB00_06825, partial [candidate division Zixibacteria bacterium]|nr:hypothetical protein [candidate division Zixibacteria bacterium]